VNRTLAAVALALLVPIAAGAAPALAAPAASPAADTPKIAFEKYVLPNGLQVILHVDRKLPIVNVNQWYHVGSKNEKPGRTGFAHLFEHMMFQGSKHVSGEYFSNVEQLGANLNEGGVNGTTNADRTNYFATVPSGNLERLLWLEADRLATLGDVTDQAKLDNQRDVVKNERRQGLENQPYGRWYQLLVENLFPAGHPYSWPVIGSQEDLSAASLDDVKEFFRTYYSPNNLTLTIAGDFDVGETKAWIEKYFGSIPPGPALARPDRFLPTLAGEKVVEVADRVPQERVYLGWITPEYYAPGDAELDLAARVLADGLSSRLQKALVYDRQLASDVNAFQFSQEISGGFVVIATARPGSSLVEIERLVGEEIARLAKEGPTAAELARAKEKQEFQYVAGLERIGGFGGKADLLAQYNTFLGDPGKFEWDLERYRKTTTADVQKAVARWLDTPNRLALRFRPETSGRIADAGLDRSVAPALGADRPFVAPTVREAKLANGLALYVVERTDLPKVAVELSSRAGALGDPAGKEGVAHLVGQTIDLGTKGRQALEIESALGDLGTELQISIGRETVGVSLELLARNLEPAMAIVADVVRNPSFPPEEFTREKQRHLDALAQQAKNANALASRVRAMLAFGREHPYGRPAVGLPATVETIERADLVAFHAARYRPASSALVLVGAVTLDQAKALAERHFGSWSGEAAAEIAIGERAPAQPGTIYLVDRQDAAQSAISEFFPGPTRTDPDADAITLADEVWGNAFNSRLNLNLREDRGYAYGAFSALVQYRKGALWFGGGGVQTDKTKESVVELKKETADLGGKRPLTEKEFEEAQLRRVRGYAQQFESFSRIADEIALLWALEQPMSELQAVSDRLAAVTLDAAHAASAKWARPERAAVVVVGDRAKVEAGLRELGPVVLVDGEGRTVQ
jgi:zinc protease